MIPIRTSVEVQDFPGAVIGLIAANVAVYLFQAGLPPDLAKQFIYQNALVPARYASPQLVRVLGLDPGDYWPFLTNAFMHGGWFHLIVNMWTLWLFGRALDQRLGAARFLAFYLACGLIASLAHFAVNIDSRIPALGASGAIAGVLGGYTLLHPRAKIVVVTPILFFPITYHLPAAIFTAIWFIYQIVPGLAERVTAEDTGGIAWWAHIGGFLAGLGLIKLFGTLRYRAREVGDAPAGPQDFGARTVRTRSIGTKKRRAQSHASPSLPTRPPPMPVWRRWMERHAETEAVGQPSLIDWEDESEPTARTGTSAIPDSGGYERKRPSSQILQSRMPRSGMSRSGAGPGPWSSDDR